MCYTVKSSITALTTGALSAFALAWKGDVSEVIIGLLFLFVVTMQIFDAIFWSTQAAVKNGDPAATRINGFFTKVAMLYNHLQPLVFGGLIIYVTGKPLPWLSLLSLVVYAAVAVAYTTDIWSHTTVTIEQPPAAPGLYWQWTDGTHRFLMYTLFMITISILFLQNLSVNTALLGLCMTAGTLFFSIERFGGKSDAGRWWCNYAAYIPLIFLIMRRDFII